MTYDKLNINTEFDKKLPFFDIMWYNAFSFWIKCFQIKSLNGATEQLYHNVILWKIPQLSYLISRCISYKWDTYNVIDQIWYSLWHCCRQPWMLKSSSKFYLNQLVFLAHFYFPHLLYELYKSKILATEQLFFSSDY